jgi:hypothetical protein
LLTPPGSDPAILIGTAAGLVMLQWTLATIFGCLRFGNFASRFSKQDSQNPPVVEFCSKDFQQ